MHRERNFTRARIAAAADEGDARRRVMRRAKRPPPPVAQIEARAAERLDCRRTQGFVLRHRRQYPRQPRCEHRFARTRRTDHDQAVFAGRRNLQRAFRVRLSLHVGEIREGLSGDHRHIAT